MELPQKGVKIYVQVNAIFRQDGVMLPNEIIWENGVSYKINRIRAIHYGYIYRPDSVGTKYTIEIHGEKKFLYFEQNPGPMKNSPGRWFVEKKAI